MKNEIVEVHPLKAAREALEPCPFCGEKLIQEGGTFQHGGPDRRCIADPVIIQDADDADAWNTRAARLSAQPQEDEVERLIEALTPSGDTKAAYHGEFSFQLFEEVSDAGIDQYRKVYVPWTTVKEIMAAIRTRGALASRSTLGSDDVSCDDPACVLRGKPHIYCQAAPHPVEQGTGWAKLRRIYDALPARPRCRDCADQAEDGRCPDGPPCDPAEWAIELIQKALATPTSVVPEGMREELEKAVKFIDDYFAPWGSWKTPWWEAEVSDDAAFSDNNALKHVANKLRALLSAHPLKDMDNG